MNGQKGHLESSECEAGLVQLLCLQARFKWEIVWNILSVEENKLTRLAQQLSS